ncbi:hypothetical protein DERP_008620 [Dermatophagoides pteronyssinus]|uniref:Uncharacterized protein n=1 Tax=Dermatophagoides pteronyssinus TaxID=6956 RepID=A0ABQ8IWV1_DERPT|nr:hypothetical protein DERP_008620 [Dermatophagoides pteronyssinus]
MNRKSIFIILITFVLIFEWTECNVTTSHYGSRTTKSPNQVSNQTSSKPKPGCLHYCNPYECNRGCVQLGFHYGLCQFLLPPQEACICYPYYT